MWLVATGSYLLGCTCITLSILFDKVFIEIFSNLSPLLYCWHWVKSFPTATLFHNSQNIFQTFDTKGATEMILTCFNLEKIHSSLALETGTVSNNLIINSTLLQHLLLVLQRFYTMWLDMKLRQEKESLHILLTHTSVSKDQE